MEQAAQPVDENREQTPDPGFAPQAPSAYANPETLLVIPRAMVNYVIIAIVFFALGAGVALFASTSLFNANSAENQKLIGDAVAAAVEALPAGQVAQEPRLKAGERYDVLADTDPSRGPVDAPITIVEFSDFRCPYCGRYVAETLTPLLANYGDRVRMVFRDYPILGPDSITAALAGECANAQGKFWEFHDLAFANQRTLNRDTLVGFAAELGLDEASFASCIDNGEYMSEISADAAYASELGVTGTPAFFINGRFVSGAQPYTTFAALIEEELNALQESGS
ncbi:MAG: thioredoxin domain-containing protein [Anaerolineae bacterium]|nr:thioredoxin domain-containing protein [Anaerolineae bacterium]